MTPYQGWIWPVELHRDGRKPVVTDGYGTALSGKRGGKGHYGVDVMYPRPASGPARLPDRTKWFELASGEARILACGPGTVWRVNHRDPRGISIELDHGLHAGVGPRVSVYRHLQRVGVSAGQAVKAGDELGRAGWDISQPATETPTHLHFELWDPSQGSLEGRPAREVWGIDPGPVLAGLDYLGPDGTYLRGTGVFPVESTRGSGGIVAGGVDGSFDGGGIV